MFPRIEYLEWIEGRPAAAIHDLAASDLRGDRDTGTAIPDILTEYDDAPAGVSLETQLATRYGVAPEQVLVTAGASHANFLATAAALDTATDRGDEDPRVLVERPGYEPLVKTPMGLGAPVDRFDRPPNEDYAIDPERVAQSLQDETALVTVTNRHNPSGRRVDRATLSTLAETVGDRESRLLVDEVYAPYTRTSTGDGPFGGPTAADLEDVVITNSVTKFFGLGDVRIGWLIADQEFVSRARRVMGHVPTVAETSRALGRRTLHAHEALTAEARSLLDTNADLITDFVGETPGITGPVYDGSTFAALGHDTLDGEDLAAVAADAGILVVPGRFFGVPDRVRVSVGRSPRDCAASLDAFARVLEGHIATG
ncbi:MAG: pyridoxal phosphate-dependent aminotransferase [Halobacteriaceae archaeon]